MNDATAAMLKGLAGKGVNAVLGGAGGAAVKMVLNLIFEGTTDPAAEALNKINEQLLDIKAQIKELPDAVTIYQAYNQAILDAQLKVSQFKDMLLFTAERKRIYKDYDVYLATLVDEQWKTMESFLTPGVKDNANAHISNILKTSYGLDKQEITETAFIDLKFGESQRSYARLRSSIDLQQLPANIATYVQGQVQVRDAVIVAISGIVSCVQNIIGVFKRMDTDALPSRNRKRIQEKLSNEELKAGYMETDPKLKVPRLYADLLGPLSLAPVFLCGNAFEVYNGILDEKNFTFKNLSTKEYVALGSKTNARISPAARANTLRQYDAKGNLENMLSYWRAQFGDKATAWQAEFPDKDKKAGVITLKGPGAGYLFIHGSSPVPGVTTKGELSNRDFCRWKLGLVPQRNADTGHRNFCFTLDNVEKEKALVNEIPFIGSDHLGYWKLDHFDGNHQWDIRLESN